MPFAHFQGRLPASVERQCRNGFVENRLIHRVAQHADLCSNEVRGGYSLRSFLHKLPRCSKFLHILRQNGGDFNDRTSLLNITIAGCECFASQVAIDCAGKVRSHFLFAQIGDMKRKEDRFTSSEDMICQGRDREGMLHVLNDV